jgi:exosortase C (VPDSG-CTERM-specific)
MNRPIRISGQMRGFILATAALMLGFSLPLYHLVRFALGSDLYSHIVLIPFIAAYLVWTKRKTLPPSSTPARSWMAAPLGAGGALLAFYGILVLSGTKLQPEDSLALTALSFVLLFWGICCRFFGKETLRALAFPLGFLIFMVPFPGFFRSWLETILQHGSAAVAYALLSIVGTPVFKQGLVFILPGISLEVAPQCSGIHSTLALFITSVVGAYFFLRRPWTRATLALAVIPLAFLRNGFRVFVIGELCVHIGPHMIHSPIHHHGGPLFFALSLIPFFLVLWWLVRLDRRAAHPGEKA